MSHLRVLISIAASLLLGTVAFAQPNQGFRSADAADADLSDQCRGLVDTFDEAVREVPKSDNLAAAEKLRRSATRQCFDDSAPSFVIRSAVEDMQAALQMIGVAVQTDRCEPRLAISPASGLDCR